MSEDIERVVEILIENLRYDAEKCADPSNGPVHDTDYARGVSAGLNHAADELEKVIQDNDQTEA